jgi:uncharacterized protein
MYVEMSRYVLYKCHPLRLNVGFLLHKNVGYSRNFDFDCKAIRIGDELDVSELKGSLHLTRTSQGMYAQGRLQANINLECVRCLTSFDQPLRVDVDDLFIYPPEEASDPLLSIPESGILDLNPLLREYLLLDVPIQSLCREECKGLCSECGSNLNESECDHSQVDIDPRLETLKTLLHKS